MYWSDGINLGIVLCNLAIAIATGLAAKAAWSSTKLVRQAAEESRRQADKMNEALLNAAKANALATRIEYYDPTVEQGRTKGWSQESTTARDQQEYLIHQLDEILDKMGAGTGQPCAGSPHNEKIDDWKRDGREVSLGRAKAASMSCPDHRWSASTARVP
jgi:hypothetical protein